MLRYSISKGYKTFPLLGTGEFPAGSDRSQVLQQECLDMRRNCGTAFLQENFADMYSHCEIYLINVFLVFLFDSYMCGN